jgi:hypothetical protein
MNEIHIIASSVADPGCLSRIPDPYHFYPSNTMQKEQQKRRGKNLLSYYLFCCHKFYIIENSLIFELVLKEI